MSKLWGNGMGIYIFILGAIFGSFYLVIGTRLPLKENVLMGRSRCDHCKKNLQWYELIPIVSYVLQLGKCRNCKKSISPIHIIIDLVTGILFVIGYLYYGISFEFGIYLTLISVLILIFVSDFKYMIILDSTLIIGSILILVLKLVAFGYNSFQNSIISGIGLFIIMYLIKIIGDKLFKRESLGGGDIKLCFLIGATIGFRLGLIGLVFSAFLALPYAMASVYFNKKNELPYGPFLIAATVIIYVFLDKFINLLVFFSLT